MRILFDQGTPVPLRRHLAGHQVETAYERGWSSLTNGDLLDHAEREGFEILVTTDLNLKFQQRLTDRHLAIVALTTTSWPRIQRHVEEVARAIDDVSGPGYSEVEIP